jgi:dipeptidyl-peptidase-4
MHKGIVASLVVCAALASPVLAQKRDFTVEELFSPATARRFRADLPTLRWLAGGKAHLRIEIDRKARRATWTKVDTASGKSAPLYDVAKLEAALVEAGVDERLAGDVARQEGLELNPAGDALVLRAVGDLWVWRIASSSLVRLTAEPGEEGQAQWSPDGKSVAFVRAHDLFAVNAGGGSERRLTVDGSPDRLNGILDWVYQEEIYGRGMFRAFWWSPDSRSLAYLQLDERDVPTYTLVDDIPTHPEPQVERYPKSGDPLPGVKLGVVAAVGGQTRWFDLSAYSGAPLLVVRVAWTPDSKQVVYQLQDREQTWLELLAAPRGGGEPRRLLREETPAFVSVQDDGLVFLPDASFLWISERSGWAHIYHHDGEGKLLRPLTAGEWEVSAIHGADAKNGWVYFSGTERSAIGSDAYRVRLDGSGLQRLTSERGSHKVAFDDGWRHFVDTWSDLVTPPRQALHASDGKRVRLLEEARIASLDEYRLGVPELVQVPTRDGFPMEAMLLRPPDFDAGKRYPVMVFTYGGPHAPSVNDAWGRDYLWYQLLAQRGVVVWVCDNRTASGKGARSTWPLWKELGRGELADIEDGLAWLKKNPWVDGARIGISGWSYGGFMTLYALTHSQSFALGIAGGSVTDWRNYDAIYTERYLLTPQRNPQGYEDSSPVHDAESLHGKLLLIHGAIDDNVHPQNTMQMAYALQKAGKPFELMLYPKSRHGVVDEKLVWHMRELMTDFILRNLGAAN